MKYEAKNCITENIHDSYETAFTDRSAEPALQ